MNCLTTSNLIRCKAVVIAVLKAAWGNSGGDVSVGLQVLQKAIAVLILGIFKVVFTEYSHV
jgi:methylglyoxal synthase